MKPESSKTRGPTYQSRPRVSDEQQNNPQHITETMSNFNPPATQAASQERPSETQLSVFGSEAGFLAGQRMAKLLSCSTLVPDSYRGPEGMPNAIIAVDMAQRMGANPLMVMQNLYIVHGRPAWSSQFIIACINACGRFSPLRYVMDGEGDSYGCRAVATDREGNLCEGPRVTIGMAKAEGWATKSGSKWKTMSELMLRYRAATLFGRLFAPELFMGIPSQDEVIDVDGADTTAARQAKPAKRAAVLDFGTEPAAEPASESANTEAE